MDSFIVWTIHDIIAPGFIAISLVLFGGVLLLRWLLHKLRKIDEALKRESK